MMRHQEEEHFDDEPLLFDLPLEPERKPTANTAASPPPERKRARLPREARPPAPRELDLDEPSQEGSSPRAEVDNLGEPRASLGTRLAAGAADLLVHASVVVGVLLGCRYLGVKPILADWPAVALFLLSFSFLYTVVPLAFWGHTPGMAWAGLDARSRDGEALAFDQTARRWLGGIATILLAGLPLLLSLRGRSLSDLLSGSETLSTRA